jgi:branched-chain amino acid transport system ATP-binding protein
VKALPNISLSVAGGEIRAIIGPNGAGKSSLINVISGLYRPDSGRVRIGERTFARVPTARLSRLGVTRTFQHLALFPNLSVLDNVAVGLAGRAHATFVEQIVGLGRAGREAAETRQRVLETIALLELDAVKDRLRRSSVRPPEASRSRSRLGLAAQDHSARRADGRNERGRKAPDGGIRPCGA